MTERVFGRKGLDVADQGRAWFDEVRSIHAISHVTICPHWRAKRERPRLSAGPSRPHDSLASLVSLSRGPLPISYNEQSSSPMPKQSGNGINLRIYM
jgi:hypothetical protein